VGGTHESGSDSDGSIGATRLQNIVQTSNDLVIYQGDRA